MKTDKQFKRKMRHKRVRAKIFGTAERPRLSVFKSNRHLSAQLINDDAQKTIASMSDQDITKGKPSSKKGEKSVAYVIGKALAEKSIALGIENSVFDRGGYKFHVAIMELAKGAREGGLKF